jgi:hypothetical protein
MFKFFWESIKSGMSMWYGWVAAISTIGGFTIWIISKIFPNITVSGWIYKLSFVILALSLFVGIAIGTYRIYREKDNELGKANINLSDLEKKLADTHPTGFTTPDQLIGTYLEGIDFRIVDLAREDLVIKNRTIVNCRIYGPAVLLVKSGTIGYCTFGGDPTKSTEENVSSFFIPVLKSKLIQGTIMLENVDFKGCTFFNIAFMGPDQLREMLIEGFRQK